MPLFIVVAKGPAAKVQAKIDANFGAPASYKFKDDVWFVDAAMTSNDLADKLGVRTGGDDVPGIVCPISSYSGRADADVWEWMKLHFGTV